LNKGLRHAAQTWREVSEYWGPDHWEFQWECTVPPDSPYTLSDIRDFRVNLQINGEELAL